MNPDALAFYLIESRSALMKRHYVTIRVYLKHCKARELWRLDLLNALDFVPTMSECDKIFVAFILKYWCIESLLYS